MLRYLMSINLPVHVGFRLGNCTDGENTEE